MKVVVDTSVWLLAFRRKHKQLSERERVATFELKDLIIQKSAVMIGPIRTELLSGIADEIVYERIRIHIRAFDDEPLTIDDFEEAAQASNRCRSHGVLGETVDFLVCSVAMRNGCQIFTTDPDFQHYARILPIRLFKSPGNTRSTFPRPR